MNNRHLFLHIGTHKTGSTSIQHYLFDHRDALRKQGFYYPCTGSYYFHGERSQSPLAFSLLDRRPWYFKDEIMPGVEQCVSDIRRDIGASDCRNVVVSSEHFSFATTEPQWRSIRQVFMPVVDSIEIIVYLRRQDTRLESQWAQSVKSGKITDSFGEFIRRQTGRDYFKFLSLISDVFQKSQIRVRPFESRQLHQGSVINDFLRLIGIVENERIRSQLNRSPSIDRLEVIRLLNRTVDSRSQRETIGKVLLSLDKADGGSRYSLFTPKERQVFLEAFRESNSLVARQFLDRSDGMLFHDESEEYHLPVYRGLTVEKLTSMTAHALLALAAANTNVHS